jgi:voltage-gated potassium channel Kch
MEEEIASRIRSGRTKIVCRSGNPADVDDIDIANVQTSRSVIVLSPDADDPDADVLKTLLAVVNDPDRRPEPYHVVAEIQRPANADAARLVGRDEVELVVADQAIAKIIAQTCRQSGLSVIYTELLNFEGDEIYTVDAGGFAGATFGEVLGAFETSAVLGIQDDRPHLNPPAETPVAAGHKLIVIASDDDTAHASSAPGHVDVGRISDALVSPATPERTLFLGWNRRAPEIVTELDKYLAPGSEIAVVAETAEAADVVEEIRPILAHSSIAFEVADTSDRSRLDALDVGRFDHVVVLSHCDDADVQHADARTLTTLIHLRDIATATGAGFSITTEMLDVRNRTLGEVAKPDDFIISNHIVSLLLAQIAESKALSAVFDELFAAEGADIYLKPARDYITSGGPVDFYTVVEAAKRRGHIALGYRRAADSDDPAQHYGVVFNPRKSDPIDFDDADRVIVLAED